MALCSRCFSIYLALFMLGIFLIKHRTKRIYWKIAILFLVPCIIDGSTEYLGLRLSNNILRFITGALAGVGIGLIFFPLYFRFVDSVTERG